jgi:hypothetical protein
MNYRHAISIIALLSIGAAAIPQQGENTSDHSMIPEKLIISLGRGIYYTRGREPKASEFGRSYSVELRGKDLHYSVIKGASEPNAEKVVTPTKERWEAFWKEVEKAQVWGWSGNGV